MGKWLLLTGILALSGALVATDVEARRLGVHVSTVRGWIRDGRVPAYRLGKRFTRIDWNAVLAAFSEQQGKSALEQEVRA